MTWKHFISNATSASRTSTRRQKIEVAALNATAMSNLSSKLLRYLLGSIIGLILAGIMVAQQNPVSTAEKSFAVVLKQKKIIANDTIIISLLLNEPFDRSKSITKYHGDPDEDGWWFVQE